MLNLNIYEPANPYIRVNNVSTYGTDITAQNNSQNLLNPSNPINWWGMKTLGSGSVRTTCVATRDYVTNTNVHMTCDGGLLLGKNKAFGVVDNNDPANGQNTLATITLNQTDGTYWQVGQGGNLDASGGMRMRFLLPDPSLAGGAAPLVGTGCAYTVIPGALLLGTDGHAVTCDPASHNFVSRW